MHHLPTPIDAEKIQAEAQISAWLYDTLDQACPYPWGSLAAVVFKEAFHKAKADQAAALPPLPVVPAPNINKMAGIYEPSTNTYYRNNGNPHVPSAGVPC
jgi:hypothetical protein